MRHHATRLKLSHTKYVLLSVLSLLLIPSAAALNDDQRNAAEQAVERGLAYLASTQNDDGSWTPQVGPAVTGLALRGFLEQENAQSTRRIESPAARKALAYVLDRVQPDGSIRDGENGILANYNTAICVSALARLRADPIAIQAVTRGATFLRNLQWQVGMTDPDGNTIDEDHPWFGGAGYGNNGRPDLSNTQFMLEALHDAGIPADDPAFQRALVFIGRLQGSSANEYWPEGTIEQTGGFIYATSVNKDLIGVPQSMASPEMTDAARAGQPVSGLRNYGSMTYAAFKSFLYADLTPNDRRVQDALGWIKANYTLDRNPGMPPDVDQQGLYYYFLTHARALSAFGEDTIDTDDLGPVDWRGRLIDALVERQNPDGSWANDAPRWMESDPNLVTAYVVQALQEALR